MKFKDFVAKYKIDLVKFSLECGSRPSTMYQYLSGRRVPRQKIAEGIERASDGLVTVREQRGCDDRDELRQKIYEFSRDFPEIQSQLDGRLRDGKKG